MQAADIQLYVLQSGKLSAIFTIRRVNRKML